MRTIHNLWRKCPPSTNSPTTNSSKSAHKEFAYLWRKSIKGCSRASTARARVAWKWGTWRQCGAVNACSNVHTSKPSARARRHSPIGEKPSPEVHTESLKLTNTRATVFHVLITDNNTNNCEHQPDTHKHSMLENALDAC